MKAHLWRFKRTLLKTSSLALQELQANQWVLSVISRSLWQEDLILTPQIKHPDLFVFAIPLISQLLLLKTLPAFSLVLNRSMGELFATVQKFYLHTQKLPYRN